MNHKKNRLTEDGKLMRADSGALISVDAAGLDSYRKKKRHAAEIDTMMEDVAEIKRVLKVLMERVSG